MEPRPKLPPHLAARRQPQEAARRPLAPRVSGDPADLWERLVALRHDRVPCVLCIVVAARGSSPRKAGARMLVLDDGTTLGTIGGGAIEQRVIEQALELLACGGPATTVEHHLTQELGMCCGGSMEVYLEPQRYAPHLLVFGAGHVAAPLVDMAALAGFAVTVIDARPEWAHEQRFPRAHKVLCDELDPALEALDVLRSDPGEVYALVLTHDHALDQTIVERLLPLRLRYLGAIGSLRKRERFRQRLAALGHDDATLERLRIPIGLDLGAVSPEEIAVSVVAELVQVRRGRDGESAAPMASLARSRKRDERG